MTTSPVRFEAGNALRTIAKPIVWEMFVEAFLLYPTDHLLGHLPGWIATLTDILSGLQVEHISTELAFEKRPWFQALMQPDPQSAAMYAEYYGVEKA